MNAESSVVFVIDDDEGVRKALSACFKRRVSRFAVTRPPWNS